MQVAYLIDQLFTSKYCTGLYVIVPRQIFCRALQDNIHTKLNGPLVQGGAERAVYEGENIMPVCNLFDFDKVKDIQIRIGR